MAISEEKSITLGLLDYIPPCNYVRLLFPIPLKPGVEYKAVYDDLVEALRKTFVQEPWANGKVFRQKPDAPDWRPGQLEIRYSPYTLESPLPWQLRYKELEGDWTYEELRDVGFPSDVFPEEDLLDAPALGDVDGVGADIFVAQANFLPGGLLLGFTTSHAATDAFGMTNIFRLWAENFRELYGRDAGGLVAPSWFTAADNDREFITRVVKQEGSKPANPDDPWLRTLVCLDVPSADGHINGVSSGPARTMLNRVFFLSSSDLAALRRETAAEPLPAGMAAPSASDAINALLWRCVMRARAASAEARGVKLDPVSVFEAPVDVRDLISSDFPGNYQGNCWLVNNARMPLAELIAPSTRIGRVVRILREGSDRLNKKTIYEAYSLLQSTPDLSRVQGRFVERPESSDMLISNIIHFQLSMLNFGDRYFELGGSPSLMRVLHSHYAPNVRLAHILPKSVTHGGVELSVNLFEDELVHFLEDEEASRYLVMLEA
ncbi:transferase family-domain-containing protein [Xylariaceae sp. FL1651]|nr:transferase family-domain-containing protein [Xylariaceae sp. FL1651]